MVDYFKNKDWSRKHDKPGTGFVAPEICYPQSLEDLIEITSSDEPHRKFKAAGSHWGLSDAALSDNVFIETNDPKGVFPAMGRTLYDVIPKCMTEGIMVEMARVLQPKFEPSTSPDFIERDNRDGTYFVHCEAGKKIYQLYSELDAALDVQVEDSLARVLNKNHQNPSYSGPWALKTMGNAGGQTIFGALTTGTHGRDFTSPPIADSVVALHLVADGGKHYWIERSSPVSEGGNFLTDDNKLNDLYGAEKYGGPDNFKIIRNDDIFNSVLVSVGRFGIVYSVVMRVVRQYSLHQERDLTRKGQNSPLLWNVIKELIKEPTSVLFGTNRSLQIVVNVSPIANFDQNRCSITKEWKVPQAGSVTPFGRNQRRGPIIKEFDTKIKGPKFQFAGNSFPYNPEQQNESSISPDFLSNACSYEDFFEGLVQALIDEINALIHGDGAGSTAVRVTSPALVSTLGPILLALLNLMPWLSTFLLWLSLNATTLGEFMEEMRDHLLGSSDPDERAAGILTWHMMMDLLFEELLSERDFRAISYAVMDGHDYMNKSCEVNIDSIEVFFNADETDVIAFVDSLLNFEVGQQQNEGKAFGGYISIRFTGQTEATIGMERWERTCVVEVAGIKDIQGTTDLIDFAITRANDPDVNAVLHWGQRNPSTQENTEDFFGDSAFGMGGSLATWRNALSHITDNGRLDRFSSEFTRRIGLEIVTPKIKSLKTNSNNITMGQPFTIFWDCQNNPSSTEIKLNMIDPSMNQSQLQDLPLKGETNGFASEQGIYEIRLLALITSNGVTRSVSETVMVNVT